MVKIVTYVSKLYLKVKYYRNLFDTLSKMLYLKFSKLAVVISQCNHIVLYFWDG